MGKIRRQYSSKIKLEAAIALISGKVPVAELCQKYSVHQTVLQRWRNDLLEKGPEIFNRRKKSDENDSSNEALERKVGQLTMELDFLKKALGK
jgi:transposase